MQAWDLNYKVQVTQGRIMEWYMKNNGNVYVSFSGGKDSTVLLDIVRRIYPDVPAAFIDTGLEYPELREFVKTIPNVFWIKPKMNFREVIKAYGYPLISKEVSQKIYDYRLKPTGYAAQRFDPDSEYNKKYKNHYTLAQYRYLRDSDIPISHRCCIVMKKQPAKNFEKQTGLRPIVGNMACESRLRKIEWLKNGCNAFDTERPVSSPMSFWTEQDVLRYIAEHNLDYAPVYGEIKSENGRYYTTKCERTGCVFCAFGCHLEKEPNRFQKLKETHPKLWNYCMRPWEEGGLGMRRVLEFIGVKVE